MKKVSDNFQSHIKAKRITGAACAVAINGKEIYREIFGYSDCAQSITLKPNSIFRLASMTKPITAVAIMICKERGLLDLDSPVGNYLNGFSHCGVGALDNGKIVVAGPAREITLRDILTHSSGLGSGAIGDLQFKAIKTPEDLSENVGAWNNRFLDFAPGIKAQYSGIVAFELAALIVEKVSQKPFAQFLYDEIFSKIGMKDTTYSLDAEQATRLVDMPLPDNKGNIKKIDWGLRGFSAFAEGYTGGSAGLFSTLDDYISFAQMLAHDGEWNGVRILSNDSVNEIGRTQFSNWGLSVYVRQDRTATQPLEPGSFGWSGAYGTHFWIEPKTRTVAILMLNHANCHGSNSPFSAEFERLVEHELTQNY